MTESDFFNIKKGIRMCGIFSDEIKINNNEANKNLFGGFLSILSVISIAGIILYFVVNFFKGTKFSLISNELATEDDYALENFNKLPIMYRASNTFSKAFPRNVMRSNLVIDYVF